MPSSKSIADIKSALLNPATTSHFEVEIPKPEGLSTRYLIENGVKLDRGKLNLLCSDAILPGSTFATHDISGDYHGTIHRHAYRRLYDDRIDLTGIETFSIDPVGCEDADDAFSIYYEENKLYLAIHIGKCYTLKPS